MRGKFISLSILIFFLLGCISCQSQAIILQAGKLEKHEGRKVVIQGSVAKEIWQHMVAPSREYPHETYFDMKDFQIIIYSKDTITCPGKVQAAGTVIRLEGSSRDPRRKEAVAEFHVYVDTWECLSR
jgi:hypothetical protein